MNYEGFKNENSSTNRFEVLHPLRAVEDPRRGFTNDYGFFNPPLRGFSTARRVGVYNRPKGYND